MPSTGTAETWARGGISWRVDQGERTAEDFDSAERTESSAEDSAPVSCLQRQTTSASRSKHVDKATCLQQAQSTTPVLMADRYVPHADSMDSPGQPTHEQNVPKCFRWYTVQQTRGLLFPRYFKWYNRLEVYFSQIFQMVQQTRGLLANPCIISLYLFFVNIMLLAIKASNTLNDPKQSKNNSLDIQHSLQECNQCLRR